MTETTDRLDLDRSEGEMWWGGAVADGQDMPFGDRPHARDLATSAGFLGADTAGCNQSAPLLVSDRGRFVWSEKPFAFRVADGTLTVEGRDLRLGEGGSTLRDAFQAAAATHFPADGRTPAEEMFTGPQYNTWIELPYEPTQQGVLDYVEGLLAAGFPPGVVMIDDRWSPSYGTWTFDRSQFPDPRAMIDRLHALGCTVMLWLVPFVSPDTATFRELAEAGLLVRDPAGDPALRRWWNGWSAVLDVTHPDALAWLHERLGALVRDHGVDGFKFDAGDLYDYRDDDITWAATDPAGHCRAWAEVGLAYPFNEYRASWKMGGRALAQRLHDKPPVWGRGGLASLIPEGIAQGLTGHAFTCPDMIGGGELTAFHTDAYALDQELFVRYAQVAALFPMMQFSVSPQRVLDAEHLAAVLAAVRLREFLLPEILDLVRGAATSGEPVIRPLEYHFPGHRDVADQFLLGEGLLVAPVLEPGVTTRTVRIPDGRWVSDEGEVVSGPVSHTVPVTLTSVPHFRRTEG